MEQKAASVDAGKIFATAIYGSANTVVLANHSAQTVTVTNTKGDMDSLLKTIAGVGVPTNDLEELKRAVVDDESNGITPVVNEGKTGGWFMKMLGRAGKGSINVGVDLLSSTVVKALEAYTGMSS